MAGLLALALLAAAGNGRAQAPQTDKLGSPRAAVQTLFSAVSASHQNPKYIGEGTACLDLSGLTAGQSDPDLLAVELEAILRTADVDSERRPRRSRRGRLRPLRPGRRPHRPSPTAGRTLAV